MICAPVFVRAQEVPPQPDDIGYEFDLDEFEDGRNRDGKGRGATLNEQRKEKIRERYQQFKNLSLEKQQVLKERWRNFKRLSPEQQQRLKQRHEQLRDMPQDKRQRLRKRYQEFRKLPQETREFLRKHREDLRQMTPEQRQEFRKQFRQRRTGQQQTSGGKDLHDNFSPMSQQRQEFHDQLNQGQTEHQQILREEGQRERPEMRQQWQEERLQPVRGRRGASGSKRSRKR